MAVEGGINWAVGNLVRVDDLLIPTYGLYGGPDYTGGRFDPAVFVDVAPLDPLDALFKAHDRAYFIIPDTDTQALARADATLISGIMALTDGQMGREAHLYAGVVELVLLHNILVDHDQDSLLTQQQVGAILADAVDNLRKGSIDPENAAESAGAALVLQSLPIFDAADALDGAAVSPPGSLTIGKPSDAFSAAVGRPGVTLLSPANLEIADNLQSAGIFQSTFQSAGTFQSTFQGAGTFQNTSAGTFQNTSAGTFQSAGTLQTDTFALLVRDADGIQSRDAQSTVIAELRLGDADDSFVVLHIDAVDTMF